jgi:hypothetical protein
MGPSSGLHLPPQITALLAVAKKRLPLILLINQKVKNTMCDYQEI